MGISAEDPKDTWQDWSFNESEEEDSTIEISPEELLNSRILCILNNSLNNNEA